MDEVRSEGSDEEAIEILPNLIISLWDAASEYNLSKSANTTLALRAALNAVISAVDEQEDDTPAAEMMTRYELDIARLHAAREKAHFDDSRVTLNARIPPFLDEYIRTFHWRANAQRKRRRQSELTLQQIVIEALSLFLAVHELPEPLPEFEW